MSLWRRIFLERRTVMLPVIALLAVNVVALVAVVLPMRTSVAGAADAKYQSSMELSKAREWQGFVQKVTTQQKQADLGLKKFYSEVLPGNFSQARDSVFSWVRDTSRTTNLQYSSIETKEPLEVRDSRLVKVTSKFTLRGAYNDIRKFLYAVEAEERFLVVENVQLAQPGAQLSSSQTLEVELTVATYYIGGGA